MIYYVKDAAKDSGQKKDGGKMLDETKRCFYLLADKTRSTLLTKHKRVGLRLTFER